jgi:hypothetical protein
MSVKTEVSDIRWLVDVYPYKSFYPQAGDAKSTSAFADKKSISLGIVGISFSRSKSSVNDVCTIECYGVLDKSLFKGNWLIVKSLYGNNIDNPVGFPQFFGQIENVSVSYSVGGNGKIVQTSSITARSWSFILRSPVKYDQFAMSQIRNEDSVAVAKIIANNDPEISSEDLEKYVTQAVNPFQFGATILAFIGGIDRTGQEQDGEYLDFVTGKLPDVALTTPAIHPDIFDSLVPINSNSKLNKFPAFMNYIAGVYQSSSLDFSRGFFLDADLLKTYRTSFKDPGDRPAITNFASILLNGDSAWDILENMTDAVANEMFADFFCVLDENNGEKAVKISPFVMVRDRPFALKRQLDELEGKIKSKWSVYDEVPRITIQASQILSIQISDSFLSSPNFIRVQYNNSELRNDAVAASAALSSTIRKPDEMSRYGGQPIYPFTSFVDIEGKLLDIWYADLAAMLYNWHGQKYKDALRGN